MTQLLLAIKDLKVRFANSHRYALGGISFEMAQNQTTALVGESGSGKTVCALSILRLTQNTQTAGSIKLNGTEVTTATEPTMEALRGSEAGMIFQEPMASLNPLHNVGKQIGEAIATKNLLADKAAITARTLELLKICGFDNPQDIAPRWPHQLSGGQRQRVVIAIALSGEPKLLIADEPTSALDVSVQRQILDLLKGLVKQFNMGLLFISHDLAVVKQVAHNLVIMKQGKIVEQTTTPKFFGGKIAHAYSKKLKNTYPTPLPARTITAPKVLEVKNLNVIHPIKSGWLRRTKSHITAAGNISFELKSGATLGIVGQSGSGKTSLALGLLGLVATAGGEIWFEGSNLAKLTPAQFRRLRHKIQIVFQDPFTSLNPRFSLNQIVGEGLDLHYRQLSATQKQARINQALTQVEIDPNWVFRYPHELSGGQRQRLAIARAIVLKPNVIILDEPTSALDVSVQSRILELLKSLQRKLNMAYLFISHDFTAVRAMADEVMVLHNGKVAEYASATEVFTNPKSGYTKDLIASLPLMA